MQAEDPSGSRENRRLIGELDRELDQRAARPLIHIVKKNERHPSRGNSHTSDRPPCAVPMASMLSYEYAH